MKVSCQVTGIRQDLYAQVNPIIVKEEKPDEEKGTYLHPQTYDMPNSTGWAYKQAPKNSKE